MTTAIAKRVITELTPAEAVVRAVERAAQIRDAARARIDADYVSRIESALSQFRPDNVESTEEPQEAELASHVG